MLLAAACLLALSAPQLADAHGWLVQPPPRNLLAKGRDGFWEPMSLNKPGTAGDGQCGGLFNGDSRFSAGGPFATNQIVATYDEGQTIDVKIFMQINHWGKFQLRLCPLSNPSTGTEQRELSNRCLDKYKLEKADGSGIWTYPLGPRSAPLPMYNQRYRLPAGVSCERCVLQWRYVTGHTCMVPGMDWDYARQNIMPFPHECKSDYMEPNAMPPEKFWNCADIKIRGGGSGGSSSASTSKSGSRKNGRKNNKKKPKGPNTCHDFNVPGSKYTCAQQKAKGRCGVKLIVKGKYCMRTCGRCNYNG